jgi:hypothetical protein
VDFHLEGSQFDPLLCVCVDFSVCRMKASPLPKIKLLESEV